jgi:hypothetical protein
MRNRNNTENFRENKDFDVLFELINNLTMSDFEQYVNLFLERKADRNLGVVELDDKLALIQNSFLRMSIFLKQQFLLNKELAKNGSKDFYYTKQEVAAKYRVSTRTVSSWITSGLEAVEIGGVKRISEQALNNFVKTSKSKKFNWRSIAR